MGSTYKNIRTDNAKEFKKKSINHQFTIPYEHTNNGKIKRGNRTLMTMVRVILLASKIPLSF